MQGGTGRAQDTTPRDPTPPPTHPTHQVVCVVVQRAALVAGGQRHRLRPQRHARPKVVRAVGRVVYDVAVARRGALEGAVGHVLGGGAGGVGVGLGAQGKA